MICDELGLKLATPVNEDQVDRLKAGIDAIWALRIVEHRIGDVLQIDTGELFAACPETRLWTDRFIEKVNKLCEKLGRAPVRVALRNDCITKVTTEGNRQVVQTDLCYYCYTTFITL